MWMSCMLRSMLMCVLWLPHCATVNSRAPLWVELCVASAQECVITDRHGCGRTCCLVTVRRS